MGKYRPSFQRHLGVCILIVFKNMKTIIKFLFSLILIVISVFLSSDCLARNKAIDARIVSDSAQVRVVAELIYSDELSYTNICNNENILNENHVTYASQLKALQNDIKNNSFALPLCYATSDKYCIQAPLREPGGSFCVDSDGNFGSEKVYCDKQNYDCAYHDGENKEINYRYDFELKQKYEKEQRSQNIINALVPALVVLFIILLFVTGFYEIIKKGLIKLFKKHE